MKTTRMQQQPLPRWEAVEATAADPRSAAKASRRRRSRWRPSMVMTRTRLFHPRAVGGAAAERAWAQRHGHSPRVVFHCSLRRTTSRSRPMISTQRAKRPPPPAHPRRLPRYRLRRPCRLLRWRRDAPAASENTSANARAPPPPKVAATCVLAKRWRPWRSSRHRRPQRYHRSRRVPLLRVRHATLFGVRGLVRVAEHRSFPRWFSATTARTRVAA